MKYKCPISFENRVLGFFKKVRTVGRRVGGKVFFLFFLFNKKWVEGDD